MRIIAGQLGGRTFKSPGSTKTHPMSDKIRGALFNILGDIEGLTVLDAFAGSGALGFEAISRGAASATLIENDLTAQRVIIENIHNLQLERRVKLIAAPASAWQATQPEVRFDIVICDPPYNDLQPQVLQRLVAAKAVDGIFVVSWPSSQVEPTFEGLRKVAHRLYGDAQLFFYS